jgi:hypothetical protein
MQVIYALYWLNTGMVYIGKTKSAKARLKSHITSLENNNHFNSDIQDYYNKQGVPDFYILEYCEDTDVYTVEKNWINEFDSVSIGLNKIGNKFQGNIIYSKEDTVLLYSNINKLTKDLPLLDTTIKCKAILVDTDSNIYYINKTTDFCNQQHNLSNSDCSDINKVIRGERLSCKGYTLYGKTKQPISTFIIKSPTGIITENIGNLAEFCRNNEILSVGWYNSASQLSRVARGVLSNYKGFTCAKKYQ